jgi:hypothetical protein
MKRKIIAAVILSLFFVLGVSLGQQARIEGGNVLSKEIPSGQALLMLQVRYTDEASIRTTYAEPLLFMHNKRPETLRAVELFMENCCSNEQFLISYLGGLDPVPHWNSRGIQPMNGRSIAFPGKLEHDQIIPNEKVRISHFRVLADDGSGTVIVFLIGPMNELVNTYKIRLGQVFTWDSARIFE